jgi:CheY-like chemotaxis protein
MIDPRPFVLLVEDEQADVTMFSRALLRPGWAELGLHVCRDGQQALDFLAERLHGAPPSLPRVIFLDLKLPKIRGLDVLRSLRSNRALNGVPIVIFTASTQPGEVQSAYDAGANSYLVKPLRFEQLRELLDTAGRYWLGLNRTP